ncbi:MAG: hypothetical protein GC201_05995 [Alphaproteobacteria bacterium]|nr:hypothetical protein [Alphaproteobacteria bacterium]
MAKAPVFTRMGVMPRAELAVQPSFVRPAAQPQSPASLAAPVRVTTTLAQARLRTAVQPVAKANPRLALQLARIRPHIVDVIDKANEGDTRDKLEVPISPVPEPADTVLFEDPADAAKKYYLPRYRLREAGGRYEIGVTAAQDGGWLLKAGLERFPAPELGNGAQGAAPLPHELALFFRYGAGPSNAIEKRVDFTEVAEDPKGVTVSATLTLSERDALLFALQTPAASPSLVVRRAITVAVRDPAPAKPTDAPVLVRDRRIALQPAVAASVARAQPIRAARPQLLRATVMPLTVQVDSGFDFSRLPDQPTPAETYHTVQRALDDAADPEPFVLDPRLHPYLYDGAATGGTAAAADFRRITVAYPQGGSDARFHAYFQDRGEPWVFYYLPDSFKLARRDTAPFLPQMVVRIAAKDGDMENAQVTVDYVVEPWIDDARLDAAHDALAREIPAATARQTEPELRPLQAKASLKLWVPGPSGSILADQPDVAIDLANGFVDSLTVKLEAFRQLYGAAYSRDATTLFSGQVMVETGLSSPESVPVEIRFADTHGDLFTFTEQPAGSDGAMAVTMQNAIESPVRINALPVRIRRGDQDVPAAIDGLALDPPPEVAPGATVSFTVRPGAPLGGDGDLDAVFDLSDVEILPEPDKILPLISDTSVPAEYERQIDVMTMPELLGDAAEPTSIILINAEFKGSGNLKLSRDQTQGVAQVRLPLMDLLLGRDTQGTYRFRQQIVRRNGSQTVDPDWREADFSLLVLPMT